MKVKLAAMTSVMPIFANERTAAKLLDMQPATFRCLVKKGVLPKPVEIGGFERWEVEQIRAITSGRVNEGDGLIEW